MPKIFVGIDLGGTNIKIGCFDHDLKLITKKSVPTEVQLGPESIVERIGQTVEKILFEKSLSFDDIIAAGIGSPGLMDFETGVVKTASNLGFTNTPLRKMLTDRLKKPAVLENDANVQAWAEYVAGAGKGTTDMVLIALGTGIGGGIITKGELVHGFDNNAGEIGHIVTYPGGRKCPCGQMGCVEAYASASSTARIATEALKNGTQSSLKKLLDKNGEITCKDVYDHLAAGDKLAKEVTDQTAEALAILCVNLLHITAPQRIIFFGGMTGAGNLLLDPVKKFFKKNIWTIKEEKVELCFAQLGDNTGIIGTAALARHEKQKLAI